MIKLFWFNIRMRLIDWLRKPEEMYCVGWEWINRLGKL